MKKFKITVNGKAYEVGVEELDQNSSNTRPPMSSPTRQPSISKPVMNRPTPPKQIVPTPPKREENIEVKKSVPQETKPVTGGNFVNAPMPGVILDIKVNPGDDVKEGDTLLILEAMKMENEISSPAFGKISSVSVKKGESVNAGDLLIVIE